MKKIICLIISILIVVFDQIAKQWVVKNLQFNASKEIIKEFFYFTHVSNSGVAFGLFKDGRIVFIPLTTIVILIIAYYIIFKSEDNFINVSLALVMGGAFGNLLDRIFRKDGVVDFLDVRFGVFKFWIFNIADSFVVIGTIILLIYMLFLYKRELTQNRKDENKKI